MTELELNYEVHRDGERVALVRFASVAAQVAAMYGNVQVLYRGIVVWSKGDEQADEIACLGIREGTQKIKEGAEQVDLARTLNHGPIPW